MIQTIEAILHQFDALAAKTDPTNARMLLDPDYAVQLADCVAKTYVMLNNGICEELTMCESCAEHRDYLRDVLEMFDEVARMGVVDEEVERRYLQFEIKLYEIRSRIRQVLKSMDAL